ncbi:MAG: HDOD domain-containing protein [Betaproteobacteria bacterium]|nr:HDOD domain-containing protein [Betaproteobacteria bacterium]
MGTSAFLAREPILDHRQELAVYDLRWAGQDSSANGMDLLALLTGPAGKNWLLGSRIVVSDRIPAPLASPSPIPKAAYVVELAGEAATIAAVQAARAAGLACCIRAPTSAPVPHELYPSLGYLSLDVSRLGPALKKVSESLRKLPAQQIGRQIALEESFSAAKDAHLDLYQGYWFLNHGTQTGAIIGPAYGNLVALMRLARENAPVSKLEDILKRDAALSFKLLRYINSAGFGLSCEIQSLRHAVTVLGYQNLYRWLGFLMVNAARKNSSDALVTTAITRGRLMELLGKDLLEAAERDNLFIVGMFSLLGAILRVPMEEITSQIPLPESIGDALTGRQGPYGPFLQLAEACEQLHDPKNREQAELLAMSLDLKPAYVNRAQIDAIVWAHALSAG